MNQNHRLFTALIMIWGVVSLACNMPLGASEPVRVLQPPTPPSGTPDSESAERVILPNPTVIPDRATSEPGNFNFAPTSTPRGAPRTEFEGSETPTPDGTPSSGELILTYTIEWRFDADDSRYAWADVELTAEGGDGEYEFYRDDRLISTSRFAYRWGSCQSNPGSFRVDSADGQSVKIDYFEKAPCP